MKNHNADGRGSRREALAYLIFGILTTLVNFALFALAELLLGEEKYLISNVIAWCGAVAFAYVTNKLLVFRAVQARGASLIKEIAEFIGARLISLLIEEAGLFLLIDLLGFDAFSVGVLSGSMIAKVILAAIVVATNYIISKFIIFRRKDG